MTYVTDPERLKLLRNRATDLLDRHTALFPRGTSLRKDLEKATLLIPHNSYPEKEVRRLEKAEKTARAQTPSHSPTR